MKPIWQRKAPSHKESPVLRVVAKAYAPAPNWCLEHATIVLVGTGLNIGASVLALPKLGTEFLPALKVTGRCHCP